MDSPLETSRHWQILGSNVHRYFLSYLILFRHRVPNLFRVDRDIYEEPLGIELCKYRYLNFQAGTINNIYVLITAAQNMCTARPWVNFQFTTKH